MKPLTLSAIALCLAGMAQASEPLPTSDTSVARGAELFQLYCTECHGRDGRAQMDVISDATDLTDPLAYYSGTSRQDIYTSIRNGAGVGMPPWAAQIPAEDDTWHLVNFIRSLWTDQQRQDNN